MLFNFKTYSFKVKFYHLYNYINKCLSDKRFDFNIPNKNEAINTVVGFFSELKRSKSILAKVLQGDLTEIRVFYALLKRKDIDYNDLVMKNKKVVKKIISWLKSEIEKRLNDSPRGKRIRQELSSLKNISSLPKNSYYYSFIKFFYQKCLRQKGTLEEDPLTIEFFKQFDILCSEDFQDLIKKTK